MITETTLREQWNQIRPEMQNVWTSIRSDEFETCKNNLSALQDLIGKKYGLEKYQVNEKLDQIVSKFQRSSDSSGNQKKQFANRNESRDNIR